jgi:hypothetical protein
MVSETLLSPDVATTATDFREPGSKIAPQPVGLGSDIWPQIALRGHATALVLTAKPCLPLSVHAEADPRGQSRADLIRRGIIRGLHRSWMLTERALGQSASVVRRSVSFALHGHEPFHVVAPTPAARITDDRERWPANVEWCCRRR